MQRLFQVVSETKLCGFEFTNLPLSMLPSTHISLTSLAARPSAWHWQVRSYYYGRREPGFWLWELPSMDVPGKSHRLLCHRVFFISTCSVTRVYWRCYVQRCVPRSRYIRNGAQGLAELLG